VTIDGKTTTYTISIGLADGPVAPSAPTEDSKTDTSIALTANVLQEFSKDAGANWQDSPVFSGLTADTTYTFVARVKATATTNASVLSNGTVIKTNVTTIITTTIKADVIDNKTGESVKSVAAQVVTETNGTKTVTVKSDDAILLKQPDGTNSTLSDFSKLNFSSIVTTNNDSTSINTDTAGVTLKSDGTIQVNNLGNGTETKVAITYELGNNQKIIIGMMDIKVSSNGDVSFTSTLIDPYGIITDKGTGKVIAGAELNLYYADTARNRAAGKVPGTLVGLPFIEGFRPNNNKNPQVSDANGGYGFMVFPNTDYYILVSKAGFQNYTSPTISVETEIVKFNIEMSNNTNSMQELPKTGRFIDLTFLIIIGIILMIVGGLGLIIFRRKQIH